jgi:hypothetical protein
LPSTPKEKKTAPTTPPVYETAPSDISNPDAPVTASVALPAGMMPSVAEAASSAATIDKPPNPILEPSEKLRFSDNILEVTLKLTNPTEQWICTRVEPSHFINANSYGFQDNSRVSPKHILSHSILLLDGDR